MKKKKLKKESKKSLTKKEPVKSPQRAKKTGDRTVKLHVKKFYDVIKKSSGYVSGVLLLQELKKADCDLHDDPHCLWKVWRQVEAEYPHAIDFIPQANTLWTGRPSGWHYVGLAQYESRKRRRLK